MNTQVKSRFAPKASTTQARAKTQVAPDPVSTTWREDMASIGLVIPTSRRVLVSMVVGFMTSFTSSYYLCSAAVWLSTAALVYSGSAFLGLLVLVIGAVLAVITASRLGYAAAKLVLGYKPGDFAGVGSSIHQATVHKVSLVRGWFTRGSSDSVEFAA